jgi:PAS domain-containing protein
MRDWELATILEGTSDAAFAVYLQGEIRTWNKAAEQLFGYRSESVLGQRCSKIFAGRTASELPICREDCYVLSCARKEIGVPNFDMRIDNTPGRPDWVNV